MSSRSGIERLTGPSRGAGGAARLKVLWIDDERARSLHPQRRQLARLVGEYFDIYTAAVPEQVAAGIAATVEGVYESWVGSRYDLSTFPFDVYLADWRLADAGDNETGQESVTHLAEAAGLATAVLAACHYPSHPSVVIPYSAYWDRLRAYGELYRILSPPGVLVAWKEGSEFKSRQHTELIREISRLYRRALRRALVLGAIHLAFSSAAEAQHALQSGSAARSWLDGQNTLTLITPWGRREMLLKALWLDTLEARRLEIPLRDHLLALCREEAQDDHELPGLVPLGKSDWDAIAAELEGLDEDDLRLWLLRRWLEPIPTLREEVLRAEQDALSYLHMSSSQESERRYELRDEIERALEAEEDPLRSPSVQDELRRLAVSASTGQDLREQPIRPSLVREPLSESQAQASDLTMRLSVLILILRTMQHRQGLLEDPEWLQITRDQLDMPEKETVLRQDFDPKATMARLARSVVFAGSEDSLGVLPAPVSAPDLHRFMDPLPKFVYFDHAIRRGTRFGARYDRLDPPLFLNELLHRRSWPSPLAPVGLDAGAGSTGPRAEGANKKSRSGHPAEGHEAPYGYKVEGGKESTALVAHETERRVVEHMFRSYLRLQSFDAVVRDLQLDSASLDGGTACGRPVPSTPREVRSILEDHTYLGLSKRGEKYYQGPHEPLVDPGLFHRVRLRIGYPLPEEIRILRGYAREIELRPEHWPWWLREPLTT